jgi:hypothetical protein
MGSVRDLLLKELGTLSRQEVKRFGISPGTKTAQPTPRAKLPAPLPQPVETAQGTQRCRACGQAKMCAPVTFVVAEYTSHSSYTPYPGAQGHRHTYQLMNAATINLCNSCRLRGYSRRVVQTFGIAAFLLLFSFCVFYEGGKSASGSRLETLTAILGLPALAAFLFGASQFLKFCERIVRFDSTVEESAALLCKDEIKSQYDARKVHIGHASGEVGELSLFTAREWGSMKG